MEQFDFNSFNSKLIFLNEFCIYVSESRHSICHQITLNIKSCSTIKSTTLQFKSSHTHTHTKNQNHIAVSLKIRFQIIFKKMFRSSRS
jgi:hypothetical protein